jgi:superfamily II DNA or RNA helicase
MQDYEAFLAQKRESAPSVGFEPRDINDALFPFQRAITIWACRKGRAAIFADCGLGKTLMQLEWARQVCDETGGRVLILAPLAVSEQTQKEGDRFGIDVAICKTDVGIMDRICITNYERLHHFDLEQFSGIVLDESSILKSQDGKTRTAIITGCQRVPYRLACTATPAPNDHMELGNHAEFVGAMSRVEMLAKFFVHDGGSTQSWRLKGHAIEPFWEWMATWAVAIRSPADIGFDADRFKLPGIEYHEHVVESGYKSGTLFHRGLGLMERRKARKASLEQRCALAAGLVTASSEPWIVWTGLNDESSTMAKLIPDAIEVTGSMSSDDKAAALHGFSEGRHRVIVTKPRIAGFGMNWQHCRNQVFVGLGDSYEQYYQAVRRSWRFGQERDVHIHVVIGDAEGDIVANIKRKEQQAADMMEGMVSAMSERTISALGSTERLRNEYATRTERGEGWTLHLGDSVELVGAMPDDSVGLSVFSPPFASLYTYSASDRDMGNCGNGQEFVDHFGYLVSQLYRVTMPGRHVAMHVMNLPSSKVRDGHIGIKDFRGDMIRLFQSHGFIYHSEVCIWKDPVTAMQRTKALGLLWKQIKKDSSMSRMGIPDYVVTMRKPGDNPEPVGHKPEDYPVDKWQKVASPVWMDINASETLQYTSAREEQDERHICPLQLEVIRRCIELWSNPGDIVMDPFTGIGSTPHEAIKMGRFGLGCELKQSYYEQAVRNCRAAEVSNKQMSLFG